MGTFHKNALPAGYALAEYAIQSVLGHGGFGITYLARDTTLGSLVAIKEFLPGEISQRNVKMTVLPNPDRQSVRDYQAGLRNFVKEARALAHFKHPHIVRVLRYLEANGTAYVVMEYEQGQGLADYLKQNGPRLDEATLLRVFIPILNGLHAVHEAKMLHLDIKPENIYLRKDGSPMLIDFGSARRAITETREGQRIALTHGYAPIEQYPDKGQQGTWTDIYALGASMYRCISGKKPDDALTRYQAVLKYQTDPLMSAAKAGERRYQPGLLECVDWAMRIHAKDRPQSARELQDALMGKRRQSAPASAPMRLNPNAPRVPLPGAMAGRQRARERLRGRIAVMLRTGRMLLMIVAIGAGLVAASYYWKEISTWASRLVENGTMPSAAPAAHHAPPTAASTTIAEPEGRRAPVAATPAPVMSAPTTPVRVLNGHTDWVQAVTFSPDGRWIVSAGVDRTIRIWNVADGTVLGALRGHSGSINALAYSPDGKWLVSAGDDGTVHVWDGITGGQRNILRGDGGALYALAFAPASDRFAAAGRDRSIYVWDAGSGRRLAVLEGHTQDVFALAFGPDGRTLVSGGADRTLRFWNLDTGAALQASAGHKDAVLALAFARDGRWLISGDAGQSLRLWDGRSFAHVRTLDATQPVLALAFAPGAAWLAAGLGNGTVALFEREPRLIAHVLSGHSDHVQAVAFSPDGRWLASAGRDRSVRLWSAGAP